MLFLPQIWGFVGAHPILYIIHTFVIFADINNVVYFYPFLTAQVTNCMFLTEISK